MLRKGWSYMKMSYGGLKITESFESCRRKAYQDGRGVWTIGWGHTAGVKEGDECSQAQADQWKAEDMAWAEATVNRLVKSALSQGEFDALVDFVYNAGSGNFEHSSLLGMVNAGELVAAAKEFEKWDWSGGKKVAGLLRRRLSEESEFKS